MQKSNIIVINIIHHVVILMNMKTINDNFLCIGIVIFVMIYILVVVPANIVIRAFSSGMQCAAVRIHELPKIDPPHMDGPSSSFSSWIRIETKYGNWAVTAVSPLEM